MAQRIELEVEITAQGEVRLTVRGVKGRSCTDLAKALEEALGQVEERTFTSEYYEVEPVVLTGRSRK